MSDCKITVTGIVQKRQTTQVSQLPMLYAFNIEAVVFDDPLIKYAEVSTETWRVEDVPDVVNNGDRVTVTGDFDWEYAPGYDSDPPEFYIRNPEITVLLEEAS